MKNSREFLIRDLEDLLDETVVREAVAEIMEKFEQAIQALPTPNRELISRYFDGVSVEQLGKENKISPEQVSQWLEQIKRELAQQLRVQYQVKQ